MRYLQLNLQCQLDHEVVLMVSLAERSANRLVDWGSDRCRTARALIAEPRELPHSTARPSAACARDGWAQADTGLAVCHVGGDRPLVFQPCCYPGGAVGVATPFLGLAQAFLVFQISSTRAWIVTSSILATWGSYFSLSDFSLKCSASMTATRLM